MLGQVRLWRAEFGYTQGLNAAVEVASNVNAWAMSIKE